MLSKHRWWAVVAAALSIFLVSADMTIVALALPAIAHHFQLADQLASAVPLAYSIPMTLFILPLGNLINRFRLLALFLLAVLGFSLSSVICGLAPNVLLFFIGRVLQGSFGALIAPLAIAVAAVVVAPHERGRAMGIIGAIAALGGVAGPAIGGLLLASWGWSAIFFVNVPVSVIAALLALSSLRGVSLGSRESESGFRQMSMLLRRPSFLWALLSLLSTVMVGGALFYLLPFDLSSVQQLAPASAGLVLLCLPLGMTVMGPVGGYFTDRYGVKPPIIASTVLLLIAGSILALSVQQPTSALDLAWRLLLVGLSLGLFDGPNQTLLVSIGSKETVGAASALSQLGRNLGFIGGPLLVSISWIWLSHSPTQMVGGMLIVVGLSLLSLLLACLSIQGKVPAISAEKGMVR